MPRGDRELKIGKFIPEYVGKMQFYLALLDDKARMPDENPSIGIIMCKSKNKAIVEYALRESNKPIGVAQYRIVSTLPEELRGQLPEPDQIAKLLGGCGVSVWKGRRMVVFALMCADVYGNINQIVVDLSLIFPRDGSLQS